ncbi:MAG TPA: nuclear transport factor 2 family protein [Xanthomonadales bacterium]|nr:nuclear transport factor 2 family protein [Xanthomonadales bacterium]
MQSKMEIVKAVMHASVRGDDKTFLDYLTDDIVYHYHVGSRPLEGKQWIQKFLNRYREITRDVNWRIDRHAETETELFVEGYEEYFDTRTNEVIAHPYMGIFEFRDGKIAAWRDYFEMNNPKHD